MKVKFYIISIFIFCISSCKSQSNLYFIDGQNLDSLPSNLNWYSINSDQTIIKYKPEIEQVVDEENDIDRNVFRTNSNSVLIIGSKKELLIGESKEIPLEDKMIGPNSKLILNSNEILFAKMIKVENEEDEIYTLNIFYKDTYEEAEIFRNCRQPKTIGQYFGCGRIPFTIEFYGDITNNGFPEILLSAEKESGVLKIFIGKEDKIYKVLYFYESE